MRSSSFGKVEHDATAALCFAPLSTLELHNEDGAQKQRVQYWACPIQVWALVKPLRSWWIFPWRGSSIKI